MYTDLHGILDWIVEETCELVDEAELGKVSRHACADEALDLLGITLLFLAAHPQTEQVLETWQERQRERNGKQSGLSQAVLAAVGLVKADRSIKPMAMLAEHQTRKRDRPCTSCGVTGFRKMGERGLACMGCYVPKAGPSGTDGASRDHG
jgi:NTP pyrophosphatase (non-canonical NTP hydrolase)